MRNLTLLALITMGLVLPTAATAQPLQAIARPPKSIPVWRCVVDTDGDGVCDLRDNCPDWPNPDQEDGNGDGVGNACQCGDVTGNGRVDRRDLWSLWLHLGQGRPLAAPDLCDVYESKEGRRGICDIADLMVLARAVFRDRSLGSACVSHASRVEHVLARVGYGGDAWTRNRVRRIGIERYLREQLQPASIPDPDFQAALDPYANGPFSTWGKSIPVLESQYCNAGSSLCTDRIETSRRVNANLAEIKLLRAVYSRHQLEAVLLDFFLNHFNVNGFTRIAIWAEQSYEQDSLRPHVLGRFEDLVQAMAEGLAMLDYLDQRRSRVGNVNENFARELAELHTVGKVGTFDEQDVQEITRVLTGYTYDSDRVFEYKAFLHDPGVKVVTLEHTEPWVFDGTLGCDGIPADAFDNEGEVLLCLLSRHPKTAERLSRKLIGRFVGEAPDPAYVKRITEVWLETDGDLAQVMEAILLSPEFLSLRAIRTKVKRPHLFAASLVRSAGPGSEGESLIAYQSFSGSRQRASFNGIMGDLVAMGEPLYEAAPPTGFPESSPAWASAGGVLSRINLADRIIAGVPDPLTRWRIPPGASEKEIVERLESALVPSGLTENTRRRVARLITELSDATLEQKVQQAASAVVAAPEFLLH